MNGMSAHRHQVSMLGEAATGKSEIVFLVAALINLSSIEVRKLGWQKKIDGVNSVARVVTSTDPVTTARVPTRATSSLPESPKLDPRSCLIVHSLSTQLLSSSPATQFHPKAFEIGNSRTFIISCFCSS